MTDEPAPAREEALVQLGEWLRGQSHVFVTPTPSTHARMLQREDSVGTTLADAFGWSRAFREELLPPDLCQVLLDAKWLVRAPNGLRSRVRFSTLDGLLLAHSAFPTVEEDAVFFGPDTYRFARFIDQEVRRQPLAAGARVIDVGCGSGAGGLLAARHAGAALGELVLTDINPGALLLARVNARLARVRASFALGDLYAPTDGRFDLILANPPYLVDDRHRTYRDGGGPLGGALSQRIVQEGLARLAPGGRLVLDTGAAIEQGRDPMREAVGRLADSQGWLWHYEELDPDVFGEELETAAYRHCDRIAAVGTVIERPAA